MTAPSETDAQHLGVLWMLKLDSGLPGSPDPATKTVNEALPKRGPTLAGFFRGRIGGPRRTTVP